MTTTPYLRLLGPVQVEHASGPTPPAPGRITELIAFLALHPWHNATLLDEAMWPGRRVTATTRNRAANQARSWLGAAPDGHPWVSLVAEAGYSLAPDTPVDWWDFRRITGGNPTRASTAQLHAALDLAGGQPLSGVLPTRYAWAETDRCEMISAIADTAYELAERALRTADIRTATWATAKGLAAEPIHEGLWRQAVTAAAATGSPDQLTRTVTHMHATLDPLGELEPETLELLATIPPRRRAVHGI